MPEPRWLNADEQRTWRAFIAAFRSLFEQLDRELQHEAGIPHTYYEILVRLSETPGWALRMSELAQRTDSSRSRLTHAVDRLQERGWVRREDYPGDRRGQVAVLTEKGMQTLRAAAPIHVEGVRAHLFDQLTPEQIGQLRTISEAIQNHLAAGQG